LLAKAFLQKSEAMKSNDIFKNSFAEMRSCFFYRIKNSSEKNYFLYQYSLGWQKPSKNANFRELYLK